MLDSLPVKVNKKRNMCYVVISGNLYEHHNLKSLLTN